MDSALPYFYTAVDGVADILTPYISQDKLDQVCLFLKQNDKTIIWSTLGALTLGTLFLASSGSSNGKKNKRKSAGSKKSYKVKIKKEKVIPVDPIKFSYDTIKSVKEELNNNFIPQVDQLEKDVIAEVETFKNDTATDKTSHSYKDSTSYRYLFLSESLLKLLMRLDGVEPNGIEDVRAQRKAAIKEVQKQCKRVDALKAIIPA